MDTETSYDWELFFIDDGSRDRTMELILQLAQDDSRISYAGLSRNFGKENAMLAGFDHVSGDCMVIMDADLQHPPTLIPEMLRLWEQGYEDVYAKRNSRGKESHLRKALSLAFYRILSRSTRYEVLQNVGDFRLLDRKCINALRDLREGERYTKGMYCWIGFKKKEIRFDTHDRIAGVSKWSYSSLLNLAIEGITSFTTAPLRMASVMGFTVAIGALFYMIWVIIKAIVWGEPVTGYPTIMTVMLFLGAVQLISIGILGEYVGRIFNETKRRPVYVISQLKEHTK
jgi:glycosyltransferase involved in cell wall biosynthesis